MLAEIRCLQPFSLQLSIMGGAALKMQAWSPAWFFLPVHDGSTFFSERATAIGNGIDMRTTQAMRDGPVYTMSCDAAAVESVEKSYVPLLAHIYEVFCSPNNAGQKPFAKDTFKFTLSFGIPHYSRKLHGSA